MKKQRTGKVISDKMQFTVKVEVVNLVSHPFYKKVIKQKSKFTAHNPDNKARLGDTVKIIETRPLSKTKRWKVIEILKASKSQNSLSEAGLPTKPADSSAKRGASMPKPKKASRKDKR